MVFFGSDKIRRGLVVAAALMAIALLSLPETSAQRREYTGRTVIKGPDRSDQGDFLGTWFYVSKLRKMALWFRESGEEIELQFRMQDSSGDFVTTDWNGRSTYEIEGKPASFAMQFDQRDVNTFSGSWERKIGDETGGKRETARFEIFRVGLGRDLLMRVTDLETTLYGGTVRTERVEEVLWTFRKISRREALWGELPF